MTTLQIRDLRRRLGLTRREFGAVFGATEKSVINWETGARLPHPFVRRLIHAVDSESQFASHYAITTVHNAVNRGSFIEALAVLLHGMH